VTIDSGYRWSISHVSFKNSAYTGMATESLCHAGHPLQWRAFPPQWRPCPYFTCSQLPTAFESYNFASNNGDNIATPCVSASSFRSLTVIEKRTLISPLDPGALSTQKFVVSVSPGKTCLENLALMDLSRPASPEQITVTSCRPAIPNVHKPCKIGFENPPSAAMSGSTCKGFVSPLSRYKSACKY
jgi:hypothetical protein